MRCNLRRHSRKIGITFLLLFSLLLCMLPVSGGPKPVLLSAVSPIQKLFFRARGALERMGSWCASRRQLIEQKQGLEERLGRLQDLLVRQQDELIRERMKLRALGSFKELEAAENFGVVEAEVVGASSISWRDSIVIDRGSAQGLEAGMPVVWGQALVGKLTAVGPRASQVQLVSDLKFKVPCYLLSSRARGLAEGDSNKGMRMNYIPAKVEVVPGEMVLSSGQGGVFPRGLIVGRVTSVGPSGLFQVLHLEPQAGLDKLETVLVLVEEKPSIDFGRRPK